MRVFPWSSRSCTFQYSGCLHGNHGCLSLQSSFLFRWIWGGRGFEKSMLEALEIRLLKASSSFPVRLWVSKKPKVEFTLLWPINRLQRCPVHPAPCLTHTQLSMGCISALFLTFPLRSNLEIIQAEAILWRLKGKDIFKKMHTVLFPHLNEW